MKKVTIRTSINILCLYGIIAAIIIELLSLCVIGWNLHFAYGLALGTCIAIVNYNIHAVSAALSLDLGKGLIITMAGYVIRLAIYGAVFLLSYKTALASGIATIFGYMTIKMAMIYHYGIKPGFHSANS